MGHLRIILIMLSLSIAASQTIVDKEEEIIEPPKSDKMMKYDGKDEKWLCKKCIKLKFAEKHTEDCSKCTSLKKDEVVKSKSKSDCSHCSRKKFRERNEFCKKCVGVKKKDNTKSKMKSTKKPSGFRKPSVYPSSPYSKVYTKAPVYSKTLKKNNVELGPFATLLRDLIKANTFID